VATALAGLDDANREAWDLYRQVVTRLAGDLAAGGMVLDRLTRDLRPSEFEDLWRRLGILYTGLNPPLPDPTQET
jgi:hypothetical protein